MRLLDKINGLCKQSKISLNILEQEAGITKGTIYRWNDSPPSIDKVQKVADYFDVSLDYLMGRNNPDDEMEEILQEFRTNPELRTMFSLAKGTTPEEVRALASVIRAIRGTDED